MRLRADLAIGRPAPEVWETIASGRGLRRVAGLVPDGEGGGSLVINMDGEDLVFDGRGAAVGDRERRTVTVEARGEERSGRGRARMVISLRVAEDGLFSTISVEAEIIVTGGLSVVSHRIAETAYRVCDEWAAAVESGLAEPGRPQALSGAPIPAAAPAPRRRLLGALLRRMGRG